MRKEEIFSKSILEQCLDTEVVQAIEEFVTVDNVPLVTKGGKIIAELFASTDIFDAIFTDNSDSAETQLIVSFHNNLGLLIQKTWVEEEDEVLKEQILYKLDQVCELLTQKQYNTVYEKYIDLLNDVVYLMFGSLSKKEDFYEYALRIDPGFGVFWCCLKNISETMPKEILVGRLYILLGMMFLSNY